MKNKSMIQRFTLLGVTVLALPALLVISAPAEAGNPAALRCIRDEVRQISSDRKDADIRIYCAGPYKKPVYFFAAWTYNGKRMNGGSYRPGKGTYVHDHIVRLCGNPCK